MPPEQSLWPPGKSTKGTEKTSPIETTTRVTAVWSTSLSSRLHETEASRGIQRVGTSKPTGKAKHPYDPERPESPAVKAALANMDMDALRKALTTRQRRFCQEYVVDFNGTAAALRAGYSTNHPDNIAAQLQRNEGIRTYIDFLTASHASKIMSVDPDWVIQGITKIILNENGRDGDKLRGFELIAKILGMLKDKTEISGPDGGAIELKQRIDEEAASFNAMLKAMTKKKTDAGE